MRSLIWAAGTLLACSRGSHSAGESGWLEPPSIQLEELSGLVLARRLVAQLPQPVGVDVECTGGGQTHRWSAESASRHELLLAGLLAETDYRCELRLLGEELETVALDFRTEALPVGMPQMEVSYPEPAGGRPGWTLFNHFRDGIDAVDHQLLVVDAEARVRWYYPLGVDIAGDVDVRHLGGDEILWGGGYGGTPEIVSIGHERRYQAPFSATGGSYHHHTEITEAGTLLSLVNQDNTDGLSSWSGFAIEERDPLTQLLEWTWTSQAAVDQGLLPASTGASDPYHANWVWRDGEDIYLNMRDMAALFLIDRRSGELRWEMGAGRDFALFDAAGQPLPEDQWFYTQHAPEIRGDRMLVYDNSTGRPGATASRVIELEVDWEGRSAQLLWEWTEPHFKQPIWGDADRVPSGNVLVAIGHCEDCSWTDEEGRSALVELGPTAEAVRWRIDFPDPMDGLYRAQRLEDCAVFGNPEGCTDPAPDGSGRSAMASRCAP